MKRLYIMDSTTITLFKDILKGVGRNPKEDRKKGGIKAHTIIKASENVPCLIRYSEAVRHDHMFLKEVFIWRQALSSPLTKDTLIMPNMKLSQKVRFGT
jgi:hypothetical protein